MDEREILIEDFGSANKMLDAAPSDLSVDVAQWEPGGTANSMARILAHTIRGEDSAFNQYLKGGQLFESGGWGPKSGVPAEDKEIWEAGWMLDLAALDEYRRAVQTSVELYLEGLDPEQLEGNLEAGGQNYRNGWVLRVGTLHHILSHAGEISTLRGIKGLTGLPI